MNRILRPILSIRATRAIILVMSTLFCTMSFGQVQDSLITNCPPEIAAELPNGTCQAIYAIDPIVTDPAMGITVEWYSTRATINGTAMSPLPIALLEAGQTFNFGLTQITIIADDGSGVTDECQTVLFVSEATNIPLDACDDVTVSAGETCNAIVTAADEVLVPTILCDEDHEDILNFSWSNTMRQQELVVNAHEGNPSFYQLYLTKYRDGAIFRQGFCEIQVTVIDTLVPALVCPTSETLLVAPDCFASYTYNVAGASIAPCDGAIVQLMGDPSGTPLAAGVYDYSFELQDDMGATVNDPAGAAPCNWTITVEESNLGSTSLSCLGEINLSIDQNCQATLEVPDILTGSNCSPMAMFMLSTNFPGIGIVTGPTLTFTDEHVGQSFDVTVIGPNGLNTCWGRVNIEDKNGPIIICPADMTITCTMPSDTSATGVPTLVGMGCTDVTIYFSDAVQTNMCDGAFQSIITRRFFAEDGAGNIGPACIQTISVEREDLMGAVLPPHWDGLDMHTGIQDNMVGSNPPLSCDGAGIVYDTIVRADGRVVPSPYANGDLIGTGFPGGVGTCGTIFSWYEDIIIDICDEDCGQSSPSYKVLRTWDVFDWCSGNTRIHQQIIKVLDTIAPVFVVGVPDLTVSTDLWGCGATINLPAVSATDNCSDVVRYSWNVSGGTYDPVTNQVYVASNALTDIGSEILLIAYAEDCCGNIAADTGLVTIIDLVPPVVVADQHTVVTLNNQSTDGHTKVYASTFDDGSWDGCGPIDWWVRRMDNACMDFDGDPDGEIDEVADFHKVIHFCCNDVAENQMVVFMVCDDGDRDGVVEMNGDDNCSTAMVEVDVQDKLAPTINCPAPREINCIEFVAFESLLDTELSEVDKAKLDVRFGSAFSNSTCGELGVQTFTSNMDEVCGVGAVTRTFVVTTDNGQATCSQRIDITLDPANVMTCDRITFPTGSAEEKANYDWCDPSDLITPFVTPIQVFECGGVSITEPIIDRDNLCTEVGINLTLDTFAFAGGACIKILAHWEVIDQCLFEENYFDNDQDDVNPFLNENGYYELYVEYDIFDTDPPVLSCDDVTLSSSDCESFTGTLSMTATDDCTDDDLVSVTYKVDIDADGDYDFPAGGGAAEGRTFNASDIDGGLLLGNHKIKWIAYDGCGNYSVCEQDITIVKQDKEPTPYCHLGLSSAVMDSVYGCSVEMWATDFVAGGFDNCNLELTYLMIPYQDIYGEPADLDDDLSVEDALDMAMPNWEFDCSYIENGEAHVIEIRIYTINSDGLYDFCDASLTLNDNFDCCPDLEFGLSTMISGNVATIEGTILESVEVGIMSNEPEFPRIQSTSDAGSYIFNSLNYDKDYELSATNNKNTKDGVTTLDLVLIQRHILGIANLDSPYKVIAADINGNGKISALDLLQLRKLILGIYANDQLPDNTSWRYVDHTFEFSDNTNPFPFSEKINVNHLSHAMYNQNFVGVKIGDVNGSISASILGDAQVRSDKKYILSVTDQAISLGSKVEIEFTAKDFASIYGMQLGLSFDNSAISFSSVESNALAIDDSRIAVTSDNVRISWNENDLKSFDQDEVLFTLVFNGLAEGLVSESLSLDKKVMASEGYNTKLEAVEIELDVRSLPSTRFELLQNEPNPFTEKTSISFNIPTNGKANVKVFDVTGKVVFERSDNYVRGINTMVIKKSDIGTSGIMYYQLTYGNESATRKMILLD